MKRLAIPLGVVGFGILLCICIFGGKALTPTKPEPLWTRGPTWTAVVATATPIIWVFDIPEWAVQTL